MPAILYVETNFLMSFATGRDLATDELVMRPPPTARLAIPAACFMEACSAFEDRRKWHADFARRLRDQINDCSRSIVWIDLEPRIKVLQQALAELEEMFGRFESRLFLALGQININIDAGLADRIDVTPGVIRWALRNQTIQDPTDNLILASILEHASGSPEPDRAFLSENSRDFDVPEVRQLLSAAGLKFFRDAGKCLDWLRSIPPRPA